jgi:hypothetical protein
VVVSEERGEISLSLNGRIARGLTLDELRVRIQTLILPRRRARAEAGRATDSNGYVTNLRDHKAERH